MRNEKPHSMVPSVDSLPWRGGDDYRISAVFGGVQRLPLWVFGCAKNQTRENEKCHGPAGRIIPTYVIRQRAIANRAN